MLALLRETYHVHEDIPVRALKLLTFEIDSNKSPDDLIELLSTVDVSLLVYQALFVQASINSEKV